MRAVTVARLLGREIEAVLSGEHTPLMLWGPPGVGKSALVAQVARDAGLPMIDLRLSQLEASDLRGMPYQKDGRVEWAIPAMLPDAVRHGPRGVLFLDEINAALPQVAAAAYQLILDRRLGDYRLPEGWVIIAAGNRLGDRGVTYAMPAPLANRFTHVELAPVIDDWLAWAEKSAVDERLRRFLQQRPDLLFVFPEQANTHAFPSPRSWAFADRALRKFADDADLLEPALIACVGEVAALLFIAWMERPQFDIDTLLAQAEPMLPDDADGRWAVLDAALVRARQLDAADKEAASRLLRLAARFEPELGERLVRVLRERLGEGLYALDAFDDWAVACSRDHGVSA
ncbi:MAG: AAA family ATPase [Halothiobacillaceae bacterium]|nr:MAG: AAA family ATPase [Halothiobacillaceae bacterium]